MYIHISHMLIVFPFPTLFSTCPGCPRGASRIRQKQQQLPRQTLQQQRIRPRPRQPTPREVNSDAQIASRE